MKPRHSRLRCDHDAIDMIVVRPRCGGLARSLKILVSLLGRGFDAAAPHDRGRDSGNPIASHRHLR